MFCFDWDILKNFTQICHDICMDYSDFKAIFSQKLHDFLWVHTQQLCNLNKERDYSEIKNK